MPALLTTYDFYKSFAVATMVADHLGYYFFPDQPWLRVIGRLSAPVWFFLIGFARRRDLGITLWLGGALLTAADMLAGQSVFPLNVLFTILAIRLLLAPVTAFADRGSAQAVAVMALLAALVAPTNAICEYGTAGLLLALYGHAARRRADAMTASSSRGAADKLSGLMGLIAGAAYLAYNQLWFDFGRAPLLVFVAGTVMVMAALARFMPGEWPGATRRLPAPSRILLQFCGRHTLLIYVAHLLMFKALGILLEPERFIWLNWKFYSATGT